MDDRRGGGGAVTALQYCRKNVHFWQSSPIAGRFDESRYWFMSRPLLSLDDIFIKDTALFGPTQSVKSVFLQCATAYRLDVKRKSMLCCSQTDDDAREFATIKLNPFLDRIAGLESTLKKGKYSATLSHRLWATHELIISGPGENAQQSKSVCYVHTDEAHRWNVEYPGAIAALNDRMGLRWDRHALHVTTAPDAGTEIDILWHAGRQNEWNLKCPDCNQLFEPLWDEASAEKYNGHKVFTKIESQSETEQLDSIRMRCPHCDARDISDHPRERIALDEGADYVAMNPTADKATESFRWNAFAPRWKPWRDLYATYLQAIQSAKLGNLEPYENWIKKQEVRTWTGDFPLLGISSGGKTYALGEIESISANMRFCSFDVQEGLKGEGFHLWAQVDEFEPSGDSKRVAYEKLLSWSDARAFQLKHGVKDSSTGCDCGHRAREVFGKCEQYHWLAMKSGDESAFINNIFEKRGGAFINVPVSLPYSEKNMESVSGRAVAGTGKLVFKRGRIPPGFCLSRHWSKPAVYPLLYALKSGQTGREYGIASDMPPEYEEQLHSYIPALDVDKKTGVTRKVLWRKIRTHDHANTTSCQNLILAIIAGFYSLDMKPKEQAA